MIKLPKLNSTLYSSNGEVWLERYVDKAVYISGKKYNLQQTMVFHKMNRDYLASQYPQWEDGDHDSNQDISWYAVKNTKSDNCYWLLIVIERTQEYYFSEKSIELTNQAAVKNATDLAVNIAGIVKETAKSIAQELNNRPK